MYNPATDFLALWRNIAGAVSKVEMPGMDYVVAALARAGLITLSVSATAPTVSQQTTAWLQTAVPSNSAEGALFLWDASASAYVPATAALFLDMLQASAGQNGVSWWTCEGAPLNTLGDDGDFAVRLDAPNGIYGPKANGAWPANPVPGTADLLTSTTLDNTFGTGTGQIIYRTPTDWEALPAGGQDSILGITVHGVPAWSALSDLLDAVFGDTQGAILYRDVHLWEALAPGGAGDVLTTAGGAANPAWQTNPTTFPSGTVMLFQQSAAPTGWTKQTDLDDYGLRVTSGDVSSVSGSDFSTVFAQTVVGDTVLNVTQIPQHTHEYQRAASGPVQSGGGGSGFGGNSNAATDGGTGGGLAHNHTVNLALSYVDVIIASKD